MMRIDGSYNNQVANPYSARMAPALNPRQQGVIAWSLGQDQSLRHERRSGDRMHGNRTNPTT